MSSSRTRSPNRGLLIAKCRRCLETLTNGIDDDMVKLKSENDMLRVETDTLRTENDMLRTENDMLRTENDMLRTENDMLRAESDTLKAENNMMKADMERVIISEAEDAEVTLALHSNPGTSLGPSRSQLSRIFESWETDWRSHLVREDELVREIARLEDVEVRRTLACYNSDTGRLHEDLVDWMKPGTLCVYSFAARQVSRLAALQLWCAQQCQFLRSMQQETDKHHLVLSYFLSSRTGATPPLSASDAASLPLSRHVVRVLLAQLVSKLGPIDRKFSDRGFDGIRWEYNDSLSLDDLVDTFAALIISASKGPQLSHENANYTVYCLVEVCGITEEIFEEMKKAMTKLSDVFDRVGDFTRSRRTVFKLMIVGHPFGCAGSFLNLDHIDIDDVPLESSPA